MGSISARLSQHDPQIMQGENLMAYLKESDIQFLKKQYTKPKTASLRKHINLMCKDCTYDKYEPGTWLQQVTLCKAVSCPLHEVRPNTNYAIPETILSYYGVNTLLFQPKNENSDEVLK